MNEKKQKQKIKIKKAKKKNKNKQKKKFLRKEEKEMMNEWMKRRKIY